MSSEGNKALVRRFLDEVFGGGNLELVDEIFAPTTYCTIQPCR